LGGSRNGGSGGEGGATGATGGGGGILMPPSTKVSGKTPDAISTGNNGAAISSAGSATAEIGGFKIGARTAGWFGVNIGVGVRMSVSIGVGVGVNIDVNVDVGVGVGV
jgi:hypothetical protein